MFEKLLPSFNKNKKCNSTVKCHCKLSKYIIPTMDGIPFVLRTLELHHVHALQPFHIDSGNYCKIQYGYRKKTGTIRFICSPLSVHEKVSHLPCEDDKIISHRALAYLLSSPDSSYKRYFDLRDSLVELGRLPYLFDIYKWDGIECAT